jgi:hypothetical protein
MTTDDTSNPRQDDEKRNGGYATLDPRRLERGVCTDTGTQRITQLRARIIILHVHIEPQGTHTVSINLRHFRWTKPRARMIVHW